MDALDFSKAVMSGDANCPDIRQFPPGLGDITLIRLDDKTEDRLLSVQVFFAGRDALPAAIGNQGPISWTLWMGCCIGGIWHFAPIVECINSYIPVGPFFKPGHISANLLYYCLPPLGVYQPNPGELIAFVATTGDTRRQNAQVTLPQRTYVTVVPYTPGEYKYTGETPIPTPAPPTPPVPCDPPMDNTPEVAELRRQVDLLKESIFTLARSLDDFTAELKSVRDDLAGKATKKEIIDMGTFVENSSAETLNQMERTLSQTYAAVLVRGMVVTKLPLRRDPPKTQGVK